MEEKSYITNCVIEMAPDDEGPLFTQLQSGELITRLNGYAIVPKDSYLDLRADRDRLRKALLRISLLRPDEGYGVMDISIFAKNALEGKP